MVLGSENLAHAVERPLKTGPRVAGSLEPRRQAVLRAEVGGSVVAVSAELGDRVKAGQVLGRIEANTLEDALVSAQSARSAAERDLENATRQLQRTERLVEAGALSSRDLELAKSEFSSVQARLSQAKAQLASAQKTLGDATVRSPMEGVVSQRQVSQGDVVAPGAPLFTVIEPSSMRLEASVPAARLSELRVGAEVEFRVRGYPGQSFLGQLERIAPAADPATRQIPILVSLPNPGGKLVAGLFAEGQVTAQVRVGVVVPVGAVEEGGTRPTVKRVRGGRVEEVQVRLGLEDERTEEVEVVEGLAAGDLVLLGGARELAAGAPVSVGAATPDAGE